MTSRPAAPYVIEADGGARGNPGPAGYGAVVKDPSGAVIAEVAEAIGTATNNVAEYRGLIAGLTALSAAVGEEAAVPVEVRMDSKLVIEQMSGRWKVKHANILPLAAQAAALARRHRVTWRWVPRERNAHADRLANEAMDAAARGEPWRAGTAPAAPPAPDRAAEPGAGPGGDAAGPEGAAEARADTVPGVGPDTGAGSRRVPGTDAEAAGSGAEAARAAGAAADARTTGTGWMPRPTRTPTTLLLLRHGETPLSVEKRFSGVGDPVLTATGLAQAEAAAARLSREPYRIDVIVSSPLKRALQTAEAVAAATGLKVVVDEGLRETDFGAWEGYTFAEIQRRWPDLLTAWLADPAVAPPGGESFEQTARRVEAAVGRITARYAGRTVLVVSHVTPIKTILRLALLAPPAALARRHRVTWRWVPREENAHADRLANEAMDAAARGVAWRSGTPPARSADQGPDRVAAGEEATEAGAGVRAETIPGLGADAEDARPAAGAEPGAAPAAQAEATPSPRAAGTGWMPRPARTPTTLLLLRHGETPLSVEKRFSGIGDPMLTPRGLAQAEAAAARLSREPYRIDVIVSSPLKRALQTAEAVAAATGVQVVVDEGLRETDFGAWEGHTFAEIQRRWPDLLTAWLADPAVAPPGGESFEQTARRVEAAVGRITARYAGRTVLVVSHVTPIKTILRLALLAPPAALHRMHLDLACLSVVDYYADGPAVVRSINDTAHLR